MRIEFNEFYNHWEGFIDNEKVCDFDYFEDENGAIWLNGAETVKKHQRKGYGSKMIESALEQYDCINISNACQMEHDERGISGDARYLTVEGAALVNSCIRKKILKDEWVINPFNNYNER